MVVDHAFRATIADFGGSGFEEIVCQVDFLNIC